MNTPRREDGSLRSWPLYVLAAPATVAVWSGWVGLGEMTGFGKVHPLPGIADGFTLNTAITLPIGVEAYAAYALGAWLTRKTLSDGTRRFARVSAIGALVLGACGQVAYHLLAAGHKPGAAIFAPAWITTLVACFPVLVLGMGATLAHLIHRDGEVSEEEPATEPDAVPAPEVAPTPPAALAPIPVEPVANTTPVPVASSGDNTEPPVGANDETTPGDNDTPEPGDKKPREVSPTPRRRPPAAGDRKRPARRSLTEWVEVAGPIFHAEFERLHRQPTGDEFATAIKKAKLGTVSASTAKNIRTEILDRAPLPTLD